MQEISLQQRPNQSFSLVLDNITYRLRVFDGGQAGMLVDTNMDTEDVCSGVRALHGDLVIPFDNLTRGAGNFMWFDDRAGPVLWENFGTDPTCRLYYVTRAELDAAGA